MAKRFDPPRFILGSYLVLWGVVLLALSGSGWAGVTLVVLGILRAGTSSQSLIAGPASTAPPGVVPERIKRRARLLALAIGAHSGLATFALGWVLRNSQYDEGMVAVIATVAMLGLLVTYGVLAVLELFTLNRGPSTVCLFIDATILALGGLRDVRVGLLLLLLFGATIWLSDRLE